MAAAELERPKAQWKAVSVWLRNRPLIFLVGAAGIVVHLLVALTGPIWAPYPYDETLVGRPYEAPSRQHLLGTDNLGRDVFSRVVYGERIVLRVALSATGVALGIGTTLGLLMAYMRGWVDAVVMRVMEIILSVPPLILALIILGALGSELRWIVLVMIFLYIPRVAMIMRGAALDVITEDFVTAAKLRGESALSIAVRELLPNVMETVFVELSIRTGFAVMFVGALSFLGFGATPPSPAWGLMINEGREYISAAPWAVLAPSIAMASLVITLSFFTEGLSLPGGRRTQSRIGR
jgi:peptide/nickel transport system permease protein